MHGNAPLAIVIFKQQRIIYVDQEHRLSTPASLRIRAFFIGYLKRAVFAVALSANCRHEPVADRQAPVDQSAQATRRGCKKRRTSRAVSVFRPNPAPPSVS